MVQTVNDSASYVFYRLKGNVIRGGKLIEAQEVGAATYLMVKNETEFYKAFFFIPLNQRSRVSSDNTAESIMKNFSGKLMLSSLEGKQNFLLDYRDGRVSDEYKKNQLLSKKLMSSGASTSGWETQCHYEMAGCTYVTWLPSCGGQFIIEYSWNCQAPTYCQSSLWTLTDYSIQEVCEQVWVPNSPNTPEDPGTGGGGEGGNPEEPTEEEYELVGLVDSIRLQDKFACFDNVATNENTTYSVRICADVPNNLYPNNLLNNGSPGHAFIELTKTNGSTTVTETIGFYPEKYKTAALGITVNGIVTNNGGHEFDASLLKMLNEAQFNATLAAAYSAAAPDYNMRTYNCTNFALNVFNAAGYTLSIPDTQSPVLNFGKTPNALYRDIKAKHANQYPGASMMNAWGAASTNCN